MRKLSAIIFLGILICNVSLAQWDINDHKIGLKKDDRIFNFLAENWNNFLDDLKKDTSCKNLPVTLTLYTETMTCYYNGIKRYMSRYDINSNQKIIDEFYSYYEYGFDLAKNMQIKWQYDNSNVYNEAVSWNERSFKRFQETIIYSKKIWINFAEIQSANSN